MIYLEKSQPAPPSLIKEKKKVHGTWRTEDVMKLLRNDFKNKCYICELKNPSSINVEHFIPHKNNRDLMFDWNNLFYSCAHCNNIKLAKEEFNNILNCTIDKEIENKIKYDVSPMPSTEPKFTAIEDSDEVKNTINLLNLVFNGETIQKRIEADYLRKALIKEIKIFGELLFDFERLLEYGEEHVAQVKLEIERQLHESSGFVSFKRDFIKNNEFFRNKFNY